MIESEPAASRGVDGAGAAQRRSGPLEGLAGQPLAWLALVLAIAALPVVRAIRAEVPADLPVLAQVPDFQLTDQNGQPYGSAELRGRTWVASFLFTRCLTICPVLVDQVYDLQRHVGGLGDSIRLVSFTVDPEHDTPDVLAAYALEHRASSRTWVFLTGPLDNVLRAVTEGLKVAMVPVEEGADPVGIVHGGHFVLVDGEGRIRGFYDMAAPGQRERLLGDLGLLANQRRRPG